METCEIYTISPPGYLTIDRNDNIEKRQQFVEHEFGSLPVLSVFLGLYAHDHICWTRLAISLEFGEIGSDCNKIIQTTSAMDRNHFMERSQQYRQAKDIEWQLLVKQPTISQH